MIPRRLDRAWPRLGEDLIALTLSARRRVLARLRRATLGRHWARRPVIQPPCVNPPKTTRARLHRRLYRPPPHDLLPPCSTPRGTGAGDRPSRALRLPWSTARRALARSARTCTLLPGAAPNPRDVLPQPGRPARTAFPGSRGATGPPLASGPWRGGSGSPRLPRPPWPRGSLAALPKPLAVAPLAGEPVPAGPGGPNGEPCSAGAGLGSAES